MAGWAAPPLRIAALHLLVLCSFAFVQPLLDVLGRNGEFFAARGSTGWEIAAFAVGLTLLPSALLTTAEAAVELFSTRLRAGVHLCFVGALAAVIALQAMKQLGGAGWILVALAAIAGVLAATAYAFIPPTRSVVSVLIPAPALFLALFLFHSDATKLTFENEARAQVASIHSAVPVVFLVFDELPIASLLDAQLRVDPIRFPHFAELARASTWFRRTTTVGEGTLHAVPAILTGRYPRPGELPRYADHPHNLFTLLGGNDVLHVDEAETHLCPPNLCPRAGGSAASRLRLLTSDASAVYLHLLLPGDLAKRIPSVSNGWQDFWGTSQGRDQVRRFDLFLRALRPAHRPTLSFLHILLPHSPWQYLPDGRRYEIPAPSGWDVRELWTQNRASVVQYWQRHLLQVGFADRLLGKLLARLRETGLYGRALVVVTADEGISFRPGAKRRPASRVNLQDVAYVPLFVKTPGQRRGRVVDRPTQAVDVLPAIAAVLGIRIPWRVDGVSAFAPAPRNRKIVLFKDAGRKLSARPSALTRRLDATLARQQALFGSDEADSSLYGIGPYRTLLGRHVGSRHVQPGSGRIRLDHVEGSGLVQVAGRVVTGRVHDIAVSVHGRIAAVVPAWHGEFWALVPGSTSTREVKVLSVEGRRQAPLLRMLASP